MRKHPSVPKRPSARLTAPLPHEQREDRGRAERVAGERAVRIHELVTDT